MGDRHEHERTRENPAAPVKNLVTYVAKKGAEAEMLALVKKHELALRKVGLVTSEPFKVWKAHNIRTGELSIVEYFEWKTQVVRRCAQTPEAGSWIHGSDL